MLFSCSPYLSFANTVPRFFKRHKGLGALVTLLFLLPVSALIAGGAWVDDPGHGGIRLGYDWKTQPSSLRRDTDGDLYYALFNTTYDHRFLYLSGDVGIFKGLEGSYLFTYLWAAEQVDSTSEEPSHFYHGLSDMWLGLKYQVLDGAYPVAVSGTVRLPNLYEGASTLNGHLLTEIPGLLRHDYDIDISVSHSFSNNTYGSVTSGIKFREGAGTNQITLSAEFGGKLPVLDGKLSGKIGLDGAFSVGEPDLSTSQDRFDGLTLGRTDPGGKNHFFDFNDASYVEPGVNLAYQILPQLGVSAGYAYIVWGHSTVVYTDINFQVGYSF